MRTKPLTILAKCRIFQHLSQTFEQLAVTQHISLILLHPLALNPCKKRKPCPDGRIIVLTDLDAIANMIQMICVNLMTHIISCQANRILTNCPSRVHVLLQKL